MTEEEIKIEKQKIDELTHLEMCMMHRFGKKPFIWKDTTLPLAEYFHNRLFIHYGGFTPEISKEIGW